MRPQSGMVLIILVFVHDGGWLMDTKKLFRLLASASERRAGASCCPTGIGAATVHEQHWFEIHYRSGYTAGYQTLALELLAELKEEQGEQADGENN